VSAFGQSVENSLAWEQHKRFQKLVRYLRSVHPRGILHFQRSVRFEVVVGCSRHGDFELYAHADEADELVTAVDFHLENFHGEDKSEDLTGHVNPAKL
jgi:predicted small metal-binding protein